MLLDSAYDVILLQETHHRDAEQGRQWIEQGAGPGRPWQGSAFLSHGSTSSKGVAILIRETADLHNTAVQSDPGTGRALRVDGTWATRDVSILCVYAPSNSERRREFFTQELLPIMPETRTVLLGGDMNCVASDLDVTANALGSRRQGYQGGLQVLQDTFSLHDAWRELHPFDRAITHTCAASGTGGRLDTWLVSSDVLPFVTKAEPILGWPGDHLAVSVHILCPILPNKGPGPWIFPLALADDPLYVTETRDFIAGFFRDNPVHCNFNRRQRWDAFKRALRDQATESARRNNARRHAEARVLQDEATYARRQFIHHPARHNTLLRWQTAHHRLQEHNSRRAAAAADRAGVLWQHYGEQSTSYFYHMAKQRMRGTIISSLKDPNLQDELIDLSAPQGRIRAGRILSDFFSSQAPHGLYAPTETSMQAADDLLAALDTNMSAAYSTSCEGEYPITQKELADALHTMPRGKRPGTDGIPYEFYVVFWDCIGDELVQVFLEAFHDTSPSLAASQLQGTIAMLYKGRGQRSEPSSYRPITLLNSDVKLLGKALATRWGPALASVVDSTQTAFLPERWIGDNVLAHLEEADYLETARTPGCLVFLDFSKAYDKLDRTWVLRSMQALGFGPHALRWVALLHDGMQARVRYNGWLSPVFPVSSGLAQGSPLSPLLYVAAAQPLAAHLRARARQSAFRSLSFPDGSPAPPSHQHADDTTLHVRGRDDVSFIMHDSIALYCEASGSSVNPGKSRAIELGTERPFHGIDPSTGIPFLSPGSTVKHLGIYLSTDRQKAATEMYTRVLATIRARISHWSCRRLTLLGRVHVAKQVIASVLTYHVTFVPPPPQLLRDIVYSIMRFVSGSANARMLPSRITYSLPWKQGGMRLIDLDTMVASMQAKVISRFLEPEVLPWKIYFSNHTSRNVPVGNLPLASRLGYGARTFLLSSAVPFGNRRVQSYSRSFHMLRPHRLVPPDLLQHETILREPLFYNHNVTENGRPLLATGEFAPLLQAGIRSVGDAFTPPDALREDVLLQRALDALPVPWRSLQYCPAPPPVGWFYHPDLPEVVLQATETWTAFSVGPDGRLREMDSCPRIPLDRVRRAVVLPWDPARPHRPGSSPSATVPQYVFHHGMDPTAWGLGKRDLIQYIVREGADRLTGIKATSAKVLPNPAHQCRPRLWDVSWGIPGTVGLTSLERDWRGTLCPDAPLATESPDPTSTVTGPGSNRRRSAATEQPAADGVGRRVRARGSEGGLDYGQGASWLALGGTSRVHWDQRASCARQSRDSSPPHTISRSLPVPYVADTDCASSAATNCLPWAPVWERLHDMSLDRRHRLTLWKLLHATLPCGAQLAYRQHVRQGASIDSVQEQARCPRPHCAGQLETVTHMLLECQVACTVWEWVIDLWVLAAGGPRPPLSVAVLLGDDQRDWQPPQTGQPLWTQLRAATIHTLTEAASLHRRGTHTSANSVAATILNILRTAMRNDCRRISMSASAFAVGVCSSTWLRGRKTTITPAQFQQHWGQPGVLYAISSTGQHVIRLSMSQPIQLPHT